MGWLLVLACVACDDGESGESGSARPAAAGDARPDPIVPGAPDFALPDDWSEQHPVLSPNAKLDAHLIGLAEASIRPNPADGGGRAWIVATRPVPGETDSIPRQTESGESERPSLEAGSSHRFEIRFETGPLGIAEGGLLFLMPEAFWYWSEAQTRDPRAPGYTTATARGGGVELEASGPDAAFRVTGRGLEAGEQVDFVYGAGEAGARVDRYAERGSELMIGVDADGDGFREWIDEGPRVDVHARPGAGLVAFGPAEIAPGETFEIVTSRLDRFGNRARWPEATRAESGTSIARFEIRVLEGSELGLAREDDGAIETSGAFDEPRRIALRPTPGEGTLRLRIEGRGALEGEGFTLPPIVLRESATRLVWADLHGHSRLSDGTGTPVDYFAYARDVARLDVVALTDHDHWGPRPLDQDPAAAERILDAARSFHAPGSFVTLPGYEWTSWLHGHRHVLYFEAQEDFEAPADVETRTDLAAGERAGAREALDPMPIYSSLDPATDRPDELWAALRGRRALTFAHHSAGEPVATNWAYRPDPELEPVTEIVSVHGSSEASDGPTPVRGGIPGYFVRDVLLHGERLGFIGSGDSHDGHPGLAQIASGQSGLAGIMTSALDRESLLEAMRARRTFATNGIRPFLSVTIDETTMGGSLVTGAERHTLRVRYEATAPIARVDLVRSGQIASLEAPEDLPFDVSDTSDTSDTSDPPDASRQSLRLVRTIPGLAPGEFHYVRIVQEDGGAAWSSPIFADAPRDPSSPERD